MPTDDDAMFGGMALGRDLLLKATLRVPNRPMRHEITQALAIELNALYRARMSALEADVIAVLEDDGIITKSSDGKLVITNDGQLLFKSEPKPPKTASSPIGNRYGNTEAAGKKATGSAPTERKLTPSGYVHVEHAGSRGGKFWRDDKGNVRYGERPHGKFTQAASPDAVVEHFRQYYAPQPFAAHDQMDLHDALVHSDALSESDHNFMDWWHDNYDEVLGSFGISRNDVEKAGGLHNISISIGGRNVGFGEAMEEFFKTNADLFVGDPQYGDIESPDDILEAVRGLMERYRKALHEDPKVQAAAQASAEKREIQRNAFYIQAEQTADEFSPLASDMVTIEDSNDLAVRMTVAMHQMGLIKRGTKGSVAQRRMRGAIAPESSLLLTRKRDLGSLWKDNQLERLNASQLMAVYVATDAQNSFSADNTYDYTPDDKNEMRDGVLDLIASKLGIDDDVAKNTLKRKLQKTSEATLKAFTDYNTGQDPHFADVFKMKMHDVAGKSDIMDQHMENVAKEQSSIEKILAAQEDDSFEPPATMKDGIWNGKTLKDPNDPSKGVWEPFGYQKKYINWMKAVKRGVIAQDAGMGKSPTVVAFMEQLRAQGKDIPAVMFLPPSLMEQWPGVIAKFAPESAQSILNLSGLSLEERKVALQSDLAKKARYIFISSGTLTGDVPDPNATEDENDGTGGSDHEMVKILQNLQGAVFIDECFPAGTMVGDVAIDKLKSGDFVPSYDESTDTFIQKRVVSTFRKAPEVMVRVRMSDGRSIACTANHPFLTPFGWKPAVLLEATFVRCSLDGKQVDRPLLEHSAQRGDGDLCSVSKGSGTKRETAIALAAERLQGGHRSPEMESGDRSRRSFACDQVGSASRQKEETFPAWTWVDSVEVLKPGSDGTFGNVCSDGFVYNIEVEETHTYLVDGVVVHNCHQGGYKKAGNTRHEIAKAVMQDREYAFGMTATPMPNSPMDLYHMANLFAPGSVGDQELWSGRMAGVVWNEDSQSYDVSNPEHLADLNKRLKPYVFYKAITDPDVVKDMGKGLTKRVGVSANKEQWPDEGDLELSKHVDSENGLSQHDYFKEGGAIDTMVALRVERIVKERQAKVDAGEINPNTGEKYEPHDEGGLSLMAGGMKMMLERQASISPALIDSSYRKADGGIAHTPKLKAICDDVIAHFSNGGQAGQAAKGIVAFCSFPGKAFPIIRKALAERGVDPSLIDTIAGDVAPAERGYIQDKYNKGHTKIALIGTVSGGAGLNLQEGGNKTLFIDEPWNPAQKRQAIGRQWRTGQTEDVSEKTYRSVGTFDMIVEQMIGGKQAMVGALLGHELPTSETFDVKGSVHDLMRRIQGSTFSEAQIKTIMENAKSYDMAASGQKESESFIKTHAKKIESLGEDWKESAAAGGKGGLGATLTDKDFEPSKARQASLNKKGASSLTKNFDETEFRGQWELDRNKRNSKQKFQMANLMEQIYKDKGDADKAEHYAKQAEALQKEYPELASEKPKASGKSGEAKKPESKAKQGAPQKEAAKPADKPKQATATVATAEDKVERQAAKTQQKESEDGRAAPIPHGSTPSKVTSKKDSLGLEFHTKENPFKEGSGRKVKGSEISQGEAHHFFERLTKTRAGDWNEFIKKELKPLWDDEDGRNPFSQDKAEEYMRRVVGALQSQGLLTRMRAAFGEKTQLYGGGKEQKK